MARDAPGVISHQASDPVVEVLARVVEQLEARGLEVFAVIDHSGEAAAVGLSMPETKLVIFGNPKGGTPIMVAHPLVALDLPLKLLIWETDDHRTFVSYNAPSYLGERYGLSDTEGKALGVVEAIAQAVGSA